MKRIASAVQANENRTNETRTQLEHSPNSVKTQSEELTSRSIFLFENLKQFIFLKFETHSGIHSCCSAFGRPFAFHCLSVSFRVLQFSLLLCGDSCRNPIQSRYSRGYLSVSISKLCGKPYLSVSIRIYFVKPYLSVSKRIYPYLFVSIRIYSYVFVSIRIYRIYF